MNKGVQPFFTVLLNCNVDNLLSWGMDFVLLVTTLWILIFLLPLYNIQALES